MELPEDQLTYQVIASFRRVYNTFGSGLLESAYVGAFIHECSKRGIKVQREVSVPLYYDGAVVARYRLDLLVDSRVIVEIKACSELHPEHIKQVFHYLRATHFEVALLFNFGARRPEFRRFTLRNALKQYKARAFSREMA